MKLETAVAMTTVLVLKRVFNGGFVHPLVSRPRARCLVAGLRGLAAITPSTLYLLILSEH